MDTTHTNQVFHRTSREGGSMSTTHPDLDITDDNEPQEVSERDRKENELIEYQINNATITELASAATSWLALTLANHSDQQIDELHKNLFHRELH